MRVLVITVLTTALVGCGQAVKVGVVLPETGSAAVYGASIKSGVRLAFADALASRRLSAEVEVLYRDSASDPLRAATAMAALCDSDAVLVIGGATSAEAGAMAPVADRNRRVLLSPSASAPAVGGGSRYFFRVFPSDELEGVRVAQFLVRTRGVRTVLIVREENDYTRGLLPVFVGELQGLGGWVVGSLHAGEPGWDAALRQALVSSNPQAVYVAGYGDVILSTIRVLRSAGYHGIVCTTSALTAGPFLQRAGEMANDLFLPLVALDLAASSEPVHGFVARYRRAYNLDPDLYAAHGYDAVLAATRALGSESEPTAEAVRDALRGMAGVRGVTGPLVFDEDGNIQRVLEIYRIHNGRPEPIDATADMGRGRTGAAPGERRQR